MRTTGGARVAPDWAQLLVEAIERPGVISDAYRRFWNYSVGNQLLALFQCFERKLEPGPINTYNKWLELGRHVKKGEKALTLCMPVTVKRKRQRSSNADDPDSAKADSEQRLVFVYKSHWFVLSQTDGKPYSPTELPHWSESRALAELSVERIPFDIVDGNCQGFARKRKLAVSPVAEHPQATLFHELAHVVLGHTERGPLEDHDRAPMCLREVEAECVALICCESLGLPGIPECRGYIQHWYRQSAESSHPIPRENALRIFRAVDMILKAGYPTEPEKIPET